MGNYTKTLHFLLPRRWLRRTPTAQRLVALVHRHALPVMPSRIAPPNPSSWTQWNACPHSNHRTYRQTSTQQPCRRKFRSQTSDNMDRWKAEQGRGREKKKIKRKKSRRERVKRKKLQMREKVGKSRNTVFFQWFVAPEGRKVGARVRYQLDEKLHAVAARSSVPNTTRRYTTLHHNTLSSTTLHYFTLHYTPLHYNSTLHYTPHLHYTTLHYTRLHYLPPHSTTLHYTTLHAILPHSATPHYITLHYLTLNDTAPHIDT